MGTGETIPGTKYVIGKYCYVKEDSGDLISCLLVGYREQEGVMIAKVRFNEENDKYGDVSVARLFSTKNISGWNDNLPAAFTFNDKTYKNGNIYFFARTNGRIQAGILRGFQENDREVVVEIPGELKCITIKYDQLLSGWRDEKELVFNRPGDSTKTVTTYPAGERLTIMYKDGTADICTLEDYSVNGIVFVQKESGDHREQGERVRCSLNFLRRSGDEALVLIDEMGDLLYDPYFNDDWVEVNEDGSWIKGTVTRIHSLGHGWGVMLKTTPPRHLTIHNADNIRLDTLFSGTSDDIGSEPQKNSETQAAQQKIFDDVLKRIHEMTSRLPGAQLYGTSSERARGRRRLLSESEQRQLLYAFARRRRRRRL